MNKKAKIIIAGLTAALAYDTAVHVVNAKRFKTLKEECDKALAKTTYLASKLDEHKVPTSEFDVIVMNALK